MDELLSLEVVERLFLVVVERLFLVVVEEEHLCVHQSHLCDFQILPEEEEEEATYDPLIM